VHPQLQVVVDEFGSASARLRVLGAAVPPESWALRPDPARWSVSECVAHLNLTGRRYVPLLRRGIQEAMRRATRAPARYRRDPVGWFLWRTTGPPVRFRVETTAPFVPDGARPQAEILAEFEWLQADQLECVRQSEGLPLGEVRITSPFDPRMQYNLYSCLTILPRHQHRHLWQAEQVLERLRRTR
jgi:hypothetical protein